MIRNIYAEDICLTKETLARNVRAVLNLQKIYNLHIYLSCEQLQSGVEYELLISAGDQSARSYRVEYDAAIQNCVYDIFSGRLSSRVTIQLAALRAGSSTQGAAAAYAGQIELDKLIVNKFYKDYVFLYQLSASQHHLNRFIVLEAGLILMSNGEFESMQRTQQQLQTHDILQYPTDLISRSFTQSQISYYKLTQTPDKADLRNEQGVVLYARQRQGAASSRMRKWDSMQKNFISLAQMIFGQQLRTTNEQQLLSNLSQLSETLVSQNITSDDFIAQVITDAEGLYAEKVDLLYYYLLYSRQDFKFAESLSVTRLLQFLRRFYLQAGYSLSLNQLIQLIYSYTRTEQQAVWNATYEGQNQNSIDVTSTVLNYVIRLVKNKIKKYLFINDPAFLAYLSPFIRGRDAAAAYGVLRIDVDIRGAMITKKINVKFSKQGVMEPHLQSHYKIYDTFVAQYMENFKYLISLESYNQISYTMFQQLMRKIPMFSSLVAMHKAIQSSPFSSIKSLPKKFFINLLLIGQTSIEFDCRLHQEDFFNTELQARIDREQKQMNQKAKYIYNKSPRDASQAHFIELQTDQFSIFTPVDQLVDHLVKKVGGKPVSTPLFQIQNWSLSVIESEKQSISLTSTDTQYISLFDLLTKSKAYNILSQA